MKKWSNISALTQSQFSECSDIPQLSCIGIFSCSACDKWRERMYSRRFGKCLQRRDFLSDRHQCRQSKLGLGPIRIRVICTFNDHGNVEAEKENVEAKIGKAPRDIAKKSRIAKHVIERLDSTKMVQKAQMAKKKANAEKIKISALKKDLYARHTIMELEASKKAKLAEELNEVQLQSTQLESLLIAKESEVEVTLSKIEAVQERLMKASSKLAEHHKELKQKKVLVQYYNSKDATDVTCAEASMVCHAIERAFSFLKGKHNTTKAKLIVETIMNGKLFNGEAASAVSEVTRQYIRIFISSLEAHESWRYKLCWKF
jgi:hypothetical protein